MSNMQNGVKCRIEPLHSQLMMILTLFLYFSQSFLQAPVQVPYDIQYESSYPAQGKSQEL